jgi:hypothetical protein
VTDGLTPDEVAAHVEAADLDPTQFTPDDLYALAKQAPAETGARRRMLSELANHEDSVGKKLASGGEVHPDVLAHYPHLSKTAGGEFDAGSVAGKVAAGVSSGAVASGIDLKTAAEKAAGRALSRSELDAVAAGLGKADWNTLLNQTSGKQFKDWQRDVARQADGSQSAGGEPAPGKDTSPAAPTAPAGSSEVPNAGPADALAAKPKRARKPAAKKPDAG